MMGVEALLALACAIGQGSAAPAVDPAEFRIWFEAAWDGRLRIAEGVADRACQFRYVFIAGMANEDMPGYFAQNTKELRAFGVPRNAIHTIYPSSKRTVEQNRADVREELFEIAARGRERVVIIAHSRGACDALAFALHEPKFIDKHVQMMFFIQGPFGGTGLADYVVGDGEPIDGRLRPSTRILAELIARRERNLFEKGKHAGTAGLTRERSREYWRRQIEENPDAVDAVGPKVFYVESLTDPARLPLFLRATGAYLSAYYGPNDGVVLFEDQSIEGLGTSLGPLDAGHSDLTRKFPSTRTGKQARRALMQAIIAAVGRSDVEQTIKRAASPRVARRRAGDR